MFLILNLIDNNEVATNFLTALTSYCLKNILHERFLSLPLNLQEIKIELLPFVPINAITKIVLPFEKQLIYHQIAS